MKKYILSFLVTGLLLSAGTASAQMAADHPGPMQYPGPYAEYMHSMDGMHEQMMQGISHTDPDVAFVQGMIPHHRGAVDMARIQLKYGKDPEMRKLAQEIIDAQEKEITFMNNWLREHGQTAR